MGPSCKLAYKPDECNSYMSHEPKREPSDVCQLSYYHESAINPWNPTALLVQSPFSYGFPMDFLLGPHCSRRGPRWLFCSEWFSCITSQRLPNVDGTIAVVYGKILTGPPHISGLKPGFSYRFSQATMVFGIDFPLNQSNDRCEVDSAVVDD